MNASEGDGAVVALRSDIETTRADLAETVNELSDRLNPTKRVSAATHGVTETTKQVVSQAQDLTKGTTAKAQNVAEAGITRGRQLTQNRQRQILGLVLIGGLFVGWRLWKHRR
jgi:hypothetical protein